MPLMKARPCTGVLSPVALSYAVTVIEPVRPLLARPEAVGSGTVKLVGSDQNNIVKEVQNLLDDSSEYQRMSKAHNPYGDGNASKSILKILRD
jgi:UDP-N-acetylglucosamine 2-epimerase (non-hydrolysing)